jgi:hypothetical protein
MCGTRGTAAVALLTKVCPPKGAVAEDAAAGAHGHWSTACRDVTTRAWLIEVTGSGRGR